MSVYGWPASHLSKILTNQTISVHFLLGTIAQIQPGTKKSFVTSWEEPSAVGESIKEPSTIDEQGTLCNMDLKCQMRKKKSNKMKERKKVPIHYFFCVTHKSKPKHLQWNVIFYCLFAEALSSKCMPLRIISC